MSVSEIKNNLDSMHFKLQNQNNLKTIHSVCTNIHMLCFVVMGTCFSFFILAQKGDGGLKILQKEIGGIQICAEIFQKNFSNIFLGVLSFILDKKKLRIKISNFFHFHRGDPYDFFQILKEIFLKIKS